MTDTDVGGDVTEEAAAIRAAMAAMGWQYIGGGPYPIRPVLRFRRARETLTVVIEAGRVPE